MQFTQRLVTADRTLSLLMIQKAKTLDPFRNRAEYPSFTLGIGPNLILGPHLIPGPDTFLFIATFV